MELDSRCTSEHIIGQTLARGLCGLLRPEFWGGAAAPPYRRMMIFVMRPNAIIFFPAQSGEKCIMHLREVFVYSKVFSLRVCMSESPGQGDSGCGFPCCGFGILSGMDRPVFQWPLSCCRPRDALKRWIVNEVKLVMFPPAARRKAARGFMPGDTVSHCTCMVKSVCPVFGSLKSH